MYQLIATDLDGTLLSPCHQILPFTRQILAHLHRQGVHLVLATGRHNIDVAFIQEQLGVPAFMITCNGARVHNPEHQLVHSVSLEQTLAEQVITPYLHEDDLTVHCYNDAGWFSNRQEQRLLDLHDGSPLPCNLFNKATIPEGLGKVFYICEDHKRLEAIEQQLHEQHPGQLEIAFSVPWCLEVMTHGVSKAQALARIAKQLDVDPEHCVAFGDGMNDAQMLNFVGKGLIMADAHHLLKSHLPHLEIIGSNRDEAVANYLAGKMLLSK